MVYALVKFFAMSQCAVWNTAVEVQTFEDTVDFMLLQNKFLKFYSKRRLGLVQSNFFFKSVSKLPSDKAVE